jgi:hypothetical protein
MSSTGNIKSVAFSPIQNLLDAPKSAIAGVRDSPEVGHTLSTLART